MPVASDTTTVLQVEHADRTFCMGEVEVKALVDADVTVAEGEFLVILGPSGSGKSTLLNLVGGTDRATSGHVWYGDRDLSALTDEALTEYRRKEVGFIFQFYNLIPTLTARENVQVVTELAEEPLEVLTALELVGLEARADHFPSQMSGGEQQRVAIARALAKRPRLLLADEPTGALDLPMARNVLGILQRLNREQRLTTILITHNPAIAKIGSRIVRIVSGRIVESRINEHPIAAGEISW